MADKIDIAKILPLLGAIARVGGALGGGGDDEIEASVEKDDKGARHASRHHPTLPNEKPPICKMLGDMFLVKKPIDPSIAAQSRSASRQRSDSTRAGIEGKAGEMAQHVNAPGNNEAQQIGAGVVDPIVDEIARLAGTSRFQQAEEQGATSMPDPSSGNAGAASGTGNVQDITPGTQANTPKPSGLLGADGKPISASPPPIPTPNGASGQKPAFQMHGGKKPWESAA